MFPNRWTQLLSLSCAVGLAGLNADAATPAIGDATNFKAFSPLPTTMEQREALVTLGRMLYFDARLSPKGQSSCNSCHALSEYGITSSGSTASKRPAYHGPAQLARSSKANDLPVEGIPQETEHNPLAKEMPPQKAVAALKAIEGYQPLFQRAFPRASDPITFEHIATALETFREGLIRPGPWDDYLRGDTSALSLEQMEGAKLFNKLGCIECHTGQYVGGLIVQRTRAGSNARKGKTGPGPQTGRFKVPSLRNVEQTAPYFQDGSASTVEDAIRVMGRSQLGIELKTPDVNLIAGWLRTLTGAIPKEYIARPTLPGEAPAQPD